MTKYVRRLVNSILFAIALAVVAPLYAGPYNFADGPTCDDYLTKILDILQHPAKFLQLPKLANSLAHRIERSRTAKRLAIEVDKYLASRTMRTDYKGGLVNIPEQHELAFEFANMVRNLPELDFFELGQMEPKNVFTEMEQFLLTVPQPYKLIRDYTGPVVGLKYGLFLNEFPSRDKPSAVVAFAPTQHLNDWAANLSLGIDQILHPEIIRLVDRVLDMQQNLDSIMIVGHSLGGGLAQGFAYKLQKALFERGLTSAFNINVVTFNAFGGKEQIEWAENEYNQDVVNAFTGTHYFIKGDPVTPLGTHIGRIDDLLGHVNQSAPETNTISFGAIDDTYGGWLVHGVASLNRAIVRSQDPSDTISTRYDIPRVMQKPRPKDLAQLVRRPIRSFRTIRLQERSIEIARQIVDFRHRYIRELYAVSESDQRALYKNWLADEIDDLNTYFEQTNNDQGLQILSSYYNSPIQ